MDSSPTASRPFELPPNVEFPDIEIPALEDSMPMDAPSIRAYFASMSQRLGRVYEWSEANDYVFWSGVLAGDSTVAVGYRPEDFGALQGRFHLIDRSSYAWQYARAYTIEFVLAILREEVDGTLTEDDIFIGEPNRLPIVYLKVPSYEALAKLRRFPTVRYVAMRSFSLETEAPMPTAQTIRSSGSSSGCDDGDDDGLQAGDTFTINPNSEVSWHIGPNGHRVSTAWDDCPQGAGIGIGLIDTGIDDDNEQLDQAESFASGLSGGRSIHKYNMYQRGFNGQPSTAVDDSCGHGTRMASILAHPRNGDGSITGIAYRSDLYSYRTGNRAVWFDKQDVLDAVVTAFEVASSTNAVKIISMSMGQQQAYSPIEDAITLAFDEGKLIFLASGSALGVPAFPARTCTTEAVAVTAIKYNDNNPLQLDNAGGASIGGFVDFAGYTQTRSAIGTGVKPYALGAQREDGTQLAWARQTSAATATYAGIAALVWSVKPQLGWLAGVNHHATSLQPGE